MLLAAAMLIGSHVLTGMVGRDLDCGRGVPELPVFVTPHWLPGRDRHGGVSAAIFLSSCCASGSASSGAGSSIWYLTCEGIWDSRFGTWDLMAPRIATSYP